MQPVWELPLLAGGIEIELPSHGRVRIRPVREDDDDLINDAYERMSERSRYMRFFSARSKLSPQLVESLTDIDHTTHFGWLIQDPDTKSEIDNEGCGLVTGAARLILDDDPTSAEASLALVDGYQGRGIGRFMIELLVATAADVGAEVLRFEILRSNGAMIGLVRKMGGTGHAIPGDASVVEYRLPVPAANETAVPAGALYKLLRHLAEQREEEE